QAPPPVAVVVPAAVRSITTVTIAPGSDVPESAGVALTRAAPLTGLASTGATAAAVSTEKLTVADAGETLPTASVAVAEAMCAPSASAAEVKLQVAPVAVTVPRNVPSMVTLTIDPVSAVPLIAGTLLVIVDPLAGEAMAGALGASASMVKVLVFGSADVI